MPSLVFVFRTFSGDGTSLLRLGGLFGMCFFFFFFFFFFFSLLELYHLAIRCQHKKEHPICESKDVARHSAAKFFALGRLLWLPSYTSPATSRLSGRSAGSTLVARTSL